MFIIYKKILQIKMIFKLSSRTYSASGSSSCSSCIGLIYSIEWALSWTQRNRLFKTWDNTNGKCTSCNQGY